MSDDGPGSGVEEEAETMPKPLRSREHRRRRLRRHGRRAYIRSVYFLPSMATLGNAICGFGAMYVATLVPGTQSPDRITTFFSQHRFTLAAYLIFGAMLFDAIDGRLARFTRHTTDFGGQLDSLADVISFGAAPAFLALELFKAGYGGAPPALSRLIWAIGALYMSCAALRLARFNVSNEHGEQHHFSFLGLPSPAAGGTIAAWILMQQDIARVAFEWGPQNRVGWVTEHLSAICLLALPVIVLFVGLLMVSHIRYPHLVNRYLRGKRSLTTLMLVLVGLLVLVVAHEYAIAIGMMIYVLAGFLSAVTRVRRQR
jgi:CDP-diacylglycerol--serine O-phosphatidyltransferase